MSSKPTILLIHGSWHTPDLHYTKFIAALEASGFDVVAPRLPTVSRASPPTLGLADDVEVVRAEATALVEQGRLVMVVGHSYGGTVMTDALPASLSHASRQSAGLSGGITSLVYLSAFLPRAGDTGVKLISGSGSLLDIADDGQGGSIPTNAVECLYNGADATEARDMADTLVPQPFAVYMTETKGEAWRFFPVTYLYCEDDMTIRPALQRRMVAAVEAARGAAIRTETLPACHSPFLSHLADTTAAVRRAWDAYA